MRNYFCRGLLSQLNLNGLRLFRQLTVVVFGDNDAIRDEPERRLMPRYSAFGFVVLEIFMKISSQVLNHRVCFCCSAIACLNKKMKTFTKFVFDETIDRSRQFAQQSAATMRSRSNLDDVSRATMRATLMRRSGSGAMIRSTTMRLPGAIIRDDGASFVLRR